MSILTIRFQTGELAGEPQSSFAALLRCHRSSEKRYRYDSAHWESGVSDCAPDDLFIVRSSEELSSSGHRRRHEHDGIVKAPYLPPIAPFPSIEAMLACLDRGRTHRHSGEPVSHWAHALQTAAMAKRAQSDAALVVAALLHDIGHVANFDNPSATPTLHGVDDRHERHAPILLSRLFGPDVTEPIRLHVDAKRYLVTVSSNYRLALSAGSKRSLELQGGPMTVGECIAFQQWPHADRALRLRCWDDMAKDPSTRLPDIQLFRAALDESLLLP